MYSAAIDPAPDKVGFALLHDEKVIVSVNCAMKGRAASALSSFVLDELAKAGVAVQDIDRWSVGAGPGSFTGLRQAAALVSGWCFGRDSVLRRCVPGAVALAAAAHPADGDVVTCIYDGRNKEVLYYNVKYSAGDYIPTEEYGVLNAVQAEEFFSAFQGRAICFSSELEAVKKVVSGDVKLLTAETAAPEVLAQIKSVAFDNDLTRLVYIRPAVYLPEVKG